ncbi:hypothetical protein ACN27F_30065 [Solwaraspora sp. WMMB335]|uniref:CRISPR-associated endonuclease Cas2 n=1 Tax=Solwaraspora sp. WMMB335 TaxID=3404118 RepID=UPI003B955EBC
MQPSWWTVTFDLPDDRDRRQLTTLLRRHGVRVLYSVFTIHIGDTHLDRLLAASAERFTGGGHLLALPSCPDCETAGYGVPLEVLPEQGWAGW